MEELIELPIGILVFCLIVRLIAAIGAGAIAWLCSAARYDRASPPPFSRIERTMPGVHPLWPPLERGRPALEGALGAVFDGEVVPGDVELGDRA